MNGRDVLCLRSPAQMAAGDRNRRKMSPKRAAALQDRVAALAALVAELEKKPNKTAEDAWQLRLLRTKLNHTRKKAEQKSEPHARGGERH